MCRAGLHGWATAADSARDRLHYSVRQLAHAGGRGRPLKVSPAVTDGAFMQPWCKVIDSRFGKVCKIAGARDDPAGPGVDVRVAAHARRIARAAQGSCDAAVAGRLACCVHYRPARWASARGLQTAEAPACDPRHWGGDSRRGLRTTLRSSPSEPRALWFWVAVGEGSREGGCKHDDVFLR